VNCNPEHQPLSLVAIESVDELMQLRESEARHHKEIESLRRQLSDAERRTERLYRELNSRSLTMGT
jgi:predicted RNase H-like nuclease (RuvC/YqgF family)